MGNHEIMTIAGLWEAGQEPAAAMAEGAQPHEPPANGLPPGAGRSSSFLQFVQNGNGPAWLGQQVLTHEPAVANYIGGEDGG